MLNELSQALLVLWPVNLAAGALLLLLLAVRRNVRQYPTFAVYLALNLILGTLAFAVYKHWGFFSKPAWGIAWSMQGLVMLIRAAAVWEVCKHLLERYRGIWALAWRVLLLCAALVLVYSAVAARGKLGFMMPKVARGFELAIATVIVGIFAFVRYYRPEVRPADFLLALGFCLYSCFTVLNNTVLERYLDGYVPLWNFLGMVAFFASIAVWAWALRHPQVDTVPQVALIPANVYQANAPQINLRLRKLNETLSKIWRIEVPRS